MAINIRLSEGSCAFEKAHPIEIVIGQGMKYEQRLGLTIGDATALSIELCNALGQAIVRERREYGKS
jgi:hypothetical protein